MPLELLSSSELELLASELEPSALVLVLVVVLALVLVLVLVGALVLVSSELSPPSPTPTLGPHPIDNTSNDHRMQKG